MFGVYILVYRKHCDDISVMVERENLKVILISKECS